MKSVHGFWEEQADKFGESDKATAPDHNYRKLEIKRMIEVIALMGHDSILDVGCGNGYSTMQLALVFPHSMIIGIDFSEKMVDLATLAAKKAGITNVSFFVGDVLSISRHPNLQHQKFDVVLTERCLINLANWEEQKLAILQMRKLMTPTGHLILVENTKEGLQKLNTMRKIVELPEIEQRWHNFYIPEDKLQEFLNEEGKSLLHHVHMENIGNLYYIISRVVYAKLCQLEGKEPEYDHPINEIASKLPNLGDHYACSPNYLMVLENVPEKE
jgi:ubiquinone/menaquinone biosynthesis C-methylase UbiE